MREREMTSKKLHKILNFINTEFSEIQEEELEEIVCSTTVWLISRLDELKALCLLEVVKKKVIDAIINNTNESEEIEKETFAVYIG